MPTPTPPLGLEQEQDYLLRVLRIRDGRFRTRIAEMYLGALEAVRSENPERLSHAAHSMRELLEKLARQHEGEPIQLRKTLASDYIRSIARDLDTARQQSRCYDALERLWQGEIDAPVAGLLRVVVEAVEKHRSNPGNAEVELGRELALGGVRIGQGVVDRLRGGIGHGNPGAGRPRRRRHRHPGPAQRDLCAERAEHRHHQRL